MVDLDDFETYPVDIKEWVITKKPYFLNKIPFNSYEYDYEIIHQLWDLHIEEMSYIQEFIQKNTETEFTMWHNTRIDERDSFLKNGILSFDGNFVTAEARTEKLLDKIGLDNKAKLSLIEKIKIYWKRDGDTRTNSVHYFLTKGQIHDPKLMEFASNLGGECIRWGISSISSNLYRQEPYKRLWICGTPCSIKFRSKLKNVSRLSQEHIVREIAYYFIMNEIYQFPYIPEDTGWVIGNVPAEDILEIKEISNFIKEQERFEDYQNFYGE